MPTLTLERKVAAAIKGGKYPDFKSIAIKFGVTVQFVTAIARHGASGPLTASEDFVSKTRTELLIRPDRKIIKDKFNGDYEKYRQCVVANFGEHK